MRRTPVTLVNNVQLPGAVAAQFTAPSGTAPSTGQPASFTYTISSALFNNTSATPVDVTVYIVTTDALGPENLVAKFTVPSAGAQPTQVPALIGQHLLPGWSIQMFASSAASITALISSYLTEL